MGQDKLNDNAQSNRISDVHIEELDDATVPAQKILSAIVRTKERSGAMHLCDIVFGRKTKKVKEREDDKLKTFGCGKDRSIKYWRFLMKSLIAQRIVRVSQSSSPIPKMTDEAWEILHGERSFFTPKFQTAILENRLPLRNDPPVPGLSPFANRVFHALKHSQEKAILSGLIPYGLLFSRRNLADIAIHLPSDEKSFLKIHGCGKRKYTAQGEAFLDIIRRLCENSPEEAENSRVSFTTSRSKHREQSVTELSTYEETLKYLHQGKSIEEIADERILSPRTIVIHVGKLMKQGHDFQTERFFTPECFRQIKEWFRIAYDGHAKSVVYASEGQLDYSEALLASYFIDKASKSQEYFQQAIDEACKIEDTIMRDDVFRHIAMRLSRVGQRKEAETLRRKIQTTVKDDPQCSELN